MTGPDCLLVSAVMFAAGWYANHLWRQLTAPPADRMSDTRAGLDELRRLHAPNVMPRRRP